MTIYGFNKTTLLDYPEHVAATVFTGGCNFRCPFCQNAGLVLCPTKQPQISEGEVFAHLEKRKGILDGLCITGGEPTLSPDLEEFIRKVKDMGVAVKLDTNGYRPEVLERLLAQGLLDYVAMDIKASKENYARVVGLFDARGSMTGYANTAETETVGHAGKMSCDFALERIERSVELLKKGSIPYEFRTTVVKGLHRIQEFEEIGKWLSGARAYFLQSYQESGEILKYCQAKDTLSLPDGSRADSCDVLPGESDMEMLGSFAVEELQQMAELAGKYIDRVELRGIE